MKTPKAKKDFNTDCHCVGCRNKAAYKMHMNWGKPGEYHLTCEEHAPDWCKQGLKQSPPAEMFGVTKSWYTLVDLPK